MTKFEEGIRKNLSEYENLNSQLLEKELEVDSIKSKINDIRASISDDLKIMNRKSFEISGYHLIRSKHVKWVINKPGLFMKWASANLSKEEFFALFEPKKSKLNEILRPAYEEFAKEIKNDNNPFGGGGLVLKEVFHRLSIRDASSND